MRGVNLSSEDMKTATWQNVITKKSAKEDREKHINNMCSEIETGKIHNKTRLISQTIRKLQEVTLHN